MKTNIRILVCLISLAVLLSMPSCSRGGRDYAEAPEAAFSTGPRMMAASDAGAPSRQVMGVRAESAVVYEAAEDHAASGSGSEIEMERKLARRASVRVRVENLDTADVSVNDLMAKFDAYAASTFAEENSRHYSLRVPAHHYDTFLAEMTGMGRLINRNESTEDVTLRYYDLEGRIASKRELLQTFQAYLRRANNIEEILAVESRIAELQFDIENTATQLRYLANRVDYATIDVVLVGPVAAAQNQSITFGERIKQLFGAFGAFFATVAVIIVGFIVYGIPLLLLVFLLYWLLFGKIGLLKKLWGIIRK